MSLLFVDSFDHYASGDFLSKWTSIVSTAPTISSGNGRNGTNCLRNTTVGSGGRQSHKTVGGTSDTLIIGFAMRQANLPVVGQRTFLELRENSTSHINVRLETSGLISVYRSTTLLGTSSAGFTANTYAYFEIKAKVHNTTGTVDVKLNETSVLSLSGIDTQNGGTGFLNAFFLSTEMSSGSDTAGQNIDWDDLYVCDSAGSVNNTFLGDVRITCLTPSGAGNSAQFTPSTGSNYQNVDDSTPDGDATYNSSATVGNKDTFAFTDPAAGGTIKGLQFASYAKKSDAGSRSLAHVTRHSGTDYDEATVALGTAYAFVMQIQELNPGTAAAWTVSDLSNAEFGYKVAA